MVSLVKNFTKKGAKIQNEYMFLLKCIMATSWIGNIYFKQIKIHLRNKISKKNFLVFRGKIITV